jgi:hypothetical protein
MFLHPGSFEYLSRIMKALSSAGFLVGGLAIGILLGKGPMSSGAASRQDTDSVSGNDRSTGSGRSSTAGSADSGIKAIRQAAPDKLASLTQQAVSTADPIENQRLLAECLLHMTAGNWRDVVSSFNKISQTTGRDPGNEWKLALFRSGQVAGAEAMDSYLATGLKNSTQCWQTLYGWSSKDPGAALAWLKKAEAEGHKTSNEFYSAVISGSALSSPQDALKLLDQIPVERRKNCAGNLVWNVVQNGGTDALEPVLQYASSLDTSDGSNEALANGLFYEATEKLLWKADHARDVPQACEVVAKLGQYGRDPNEATQAVLRKFRWYFMPDKLNILETVSAGPQGSELQLASLTSDVLNTMNGDGDAVAVYEWMKQHPDSPLIPHLSKRIKAAP